MRRVLIPRLLVLLMLLCAAPAAGQGRQDLTDSEAASLRSRISAVQRTERVRLIVDLMRGRYAADPVEVRRYGHEALRLLRRNPDPALQADVLSYLGSAFYTEGKRDSSLAYARAARDLALRTAELRTMERADAEGLRERAAEAERLIGLNLMYSGQFDEAEASLRSAHDRYERLGNRARAGALINDLAVLYKTKGELQRAIEFHERALALFMELGHEKEIADAQHGLAVVYNLMGRSAEALEAFHEVLLYREREGDQDALATTLSNMGGVFEFQNDYEQALSHYLRAHEIYESLGLTRRVATSLTNIAGAHFHLGHLSEAETNYERARALAIETQNNRLLAYINEGMGRLHEAQNQPELARAAFDAALEGFEQLGDRRGIATALISLGRTGRDTESTSLVRRAADIAAEMQSFQLLRDAYLVLADLYEAQGNPAEALAAYKAYKAAYDSLFSADNRTTIARIEAEYQSREQAQRIALLEQKRQVQRMWMMGIVSVVGFLGVITALSFNRVRLRQRALAAMEQAHRAESEQARLAAEAAEARARVLQAENERKAQELEAARRMQLSMLPREVPEHPEVDVATFMRTAAEVGGDYYDFDLTDDGTLTIAIGDATGHGTQAGTMVAAVKSLFSDYAATADLTTVLRRSARALRRMALPNVYMAFALARYRGGELELAGAGMPPALIHRAKTGAVESVSLKGMPLGAPSDLPYASECVRLAPGDTLVLLSDGFPELRNEAGEEYGYDAVTDLVRRLAARPMDEIPSEIEAAIRAWCGEEAVRDDVTFVAVRRK